MCVFPCWFPEHRSGALRFFQGESLALRAAPQKVREDRTAEDQEDRRSDCPNDRVGLGVAGELARGVLRNADRALGGFLDVVDGLLDRSFGGVEHLAGWCRD